MPAHPQVRLSVARALRVIVSAWERPGAEGGEEGEAEREAPDAAVNPPPPPPHPVLIGHAASLTPY